MMKKILFAGDTHGVLSTIKILLREAKKQECDAIFQLGDFGYWEHTKEGVFFLDQVSKAAKQTGIPIYFLDGNHDKTSLLLAMYDRRDADGFIQLADHVKYSPRGHRWSWEGCRFISLGGAYSVDKAWRLYEEKKISRQISHANQYRPEGKKISTDTSGRLWFPEEEMTDIDMDNFLMDKSKVDIMLAHDKPRASNPDWNRKDFPECLPNQMRLQKAVTTLQPSLYLHGHLHYPYVDQIRCGNDGKFTTVRGLNADGEKGTCMVLNVSEYANYLK